MGSRSKRAAMWLAKDGPGLEAPVTLSPRLRRGEDRLNELRRSGEQVCRSFPVAEHLTIDMILELRIDAPARDVLQAQIPIGVDFRAFSPFSEVGFASGICRE
jgi:hypothetical protein